MKGAVLDKRDSFFENVAVIIEQARAYVGRTADLTMCVTNFEIGRMIVEREQDGKARVEYGRGLLKELSKYLTSRFGKGFSESNLKNFRQFYQVYAPSIQQTMFAESETRKSQSLISVFTGKNSLSIRQSLISESYPFSIERKLDEADYTAAVSDVRYTHEEIFTKLKKRANG